MSHQLAEHTLGNMQGTPPYLGALGGVSKFGSGEAPAADRMTRLPLLLTELLPANLDDA